MTIIETEKIIGVSEVTRTKIPLPEPGPETFASLGNFLADFDRRSWKYCMQKLVADPEFTGLAREINQKPNASFATYPQTTPDFLAAEITCSRFNAYAHLRRTNLDLWLKLQEIASRSQSHKSALLNYWVKQMPDVDQETFGVSKRVLEMVAALASSGKYFDAAARFQTRIGNDPRFNQQTVKTAGEQYLYTFTEYGKPTEIWSLLEAMITDKAQNHLADFAAQLGSIAGKNPNGDFPKYISTIDNVLRSVVTIPAQVLAAWKNLRKMRMDLIEKGYPIDIDLPDVISTELNGRIPLELLLSLRTKATIEWEAELNKMQDPAQEIHDGFAPHLNVLIPPVNATHLVMHSGHLGGLALGKSVVDVIDIEVNSLKRVAGIFALPLLKAMFPNDPVDETALIQAIILKTGARELGRRIVSKDDIGSNSGLGTFRKEHPQLTEFLDEAKSELLAHAVLVKSFPDVTSQQARTLIQATVALAQYMYLSSPTDAKDSGNLIRRTGQMVLSRLLQAGVIVPLTGRSGYTVLENQAVTGLQLLADHGGSLVKDFYLPTSIIYPETDWVRLDRMDFIYPNSSADTYFNDLNLASRNFVNNFVPYSTSYSTSGVEL